ncbi:NAD-dependent epimerase/dehydratase family protein [Planctomyces sp. SH-PL62]|uniref:NAD-dependent epimerase/dehydratase family protein n=1 Tax=Planctomyces sp. SH-PL62 TaxID=1636152 RepID=UPI00078E2458|nr:NAD-dependent epimerase/dehydratase family protein [Planctomyces sp. SH-PL62]AMV40848.1 UDP-glucose 4-epimerase [Planctomyces sp. SH-PL62]
MKVFVTGHRGFIGSHLVDLLKQEGHTVVGCDVRLFEGCEWEPIVPADVDLVKDVRKVEHVDLKGCDAVMHLAALSNDPMGALNSQITFDINRDASIRLARIAKEAGVPRYLFAGSCSVYGQGEKLDLDEGDPLNPLTAYAQSKIETEQEVSKLADDSFSPTYLRNATAYGHSPVLRIDLVVNNLLGSALSYGEIRIQSDGSPWRPLIHCRDIARTFIALANAPKEVVHDKAINVGANSENYQVKDVGDQVQRLVPDAKITYTGEVGADPRNYRVNFDLPLLAPPRLQAPVQPGQRHGGTPPQDGRARLQQGRLRGRPLRPPADPQGPHGPPGLS